MKRTLAALLVVLSLSPAARAQDFDMGGSFAWMLEAMMEAMVTFMDRMRDPVGGYGGSPWSGAPGFSNPWSNPWAPASPWAPGAGAFPGYGGWPGSGGPWSGADNPWAGPGGAAYYMPKLNGAWYGVDGSLLHIQADRFQLGAGGGGVVRGGLGYLPNGFLALRPAGGRAVRYEYAVIDDFLILRDAGGQPLLFHRIPESYLRGW